MSDAPTVSSVHTAISTVINPTLRTLGKNPISLAEFATGMTCIGACKTFDKGYARVVEGLFERYRAVNASQIHATLEQANNSDPGHAQQKAVETFLIPTNLPVGLKKRLKDRFGIQLNSSIVRSEYEKGSLKADLEIETVNEGLPLFFPRDEQKTHVYARTNYAFTGPLGRCFSTGLAKPGTWTTKTKVVRGGAYADYNTSFVVFAKYKSRLGNLFKKFALFFRGTNRESSDFGKDTEDKLFRDETTLYAVSVAKPFGGTFPERGNRFTFSATGAIPGGGFYSGSQALRAALLQITSPDVNMDAMSDRVGEEFEGVKLVGIADKRELSDGRGYESHSIPNRTIHSTTRIWWKRNQH